MPPPFAPTTREEAHPRESQPLTLLGKRRTSTAAAGKTARVRVWISLLCLRCVRTRSHVLLSKKRAGDYFRTIGTHLVSSATVLEPSTGTRRRLEETGSFPMSTRSRILDADGGGEGEDDILMAKSLVCSEPTDVAETSQLWSNLFFFFSDFFLAFFLYGLFFFFFPGFVVDNRKNIYVATRAKSPTRRPARSFRKYF